MMEANDGTDLLLCDGPCLRSFHLGCLEKAEAAKNKACKSPAKKGGKGRGKGKGAAAATAAAAAAAAAAATTTAAITATTTAAVKEQFGADDWICTECVAGAHACWVCKEVSVQ
jgi:hypothetical protein